MHEKEAIHWVLFYLLRKHFLAESKVRENEMTIFIKKNVLEFYVAIDDPKLSDLYECVHRKESEF